MVMDMRLFLLDGMALIYRAHFAFITNPIRNSKGINTSALYGFTNTLLTIIQKEQPTHLGVAFDTQAPTARHIKFPAYKAQRDATPEELLAAIPHVKRMCQAFRIPVLELDGYEADDIIGTLAHRADADGSFHTYMVTPDKDFSQLVTPTSSIWRPGRKGTDHEVLDVATILQQWEISRTAQVIDILGLWGDASDNIPGIPGVGEKTAKKLIAQWDSIENLIAHADQVKGKLGENLKAYADQALLSKELATIQIDVPIDSSWEDLALSPYPEKEIKELFAEFEFRTLTKRLFPEASSTPTAPASASESSTSVLRNIRDTPHEYHIADTPEAVVRLLDELRAQSSFCFDTETTSLDPFEARLLGISFSWKEHHGWYLPLTEDRAIPAELRAIFSSSREKIGHNLKYDLAVFSQLDIACEGPFFDTMLAHSLLHPEQRHGMDRLAESYLHYSPIPFSQIAQSHPDATMAASDDLFAFAEAQPKKKKDLSVAHIALETLAEYATEDADITWQLAQLLKRELADTQQTSIFETIESPLLPVLVRMEQQGIAIDLPTLSRIGQQLQQTIDSLTQSIHQHAGKSFNLNSPKQLGEILFQQLQLAEKAKKTTTGQFKTDEATLTALQGTHPIIDEILEYREASKLKSTYVDALPNHVQPKTQRIHTTFHQLIAATGRLASSDPNIQNIPVRSTLGKQIRQAFIPAPGCTLLSCDYSQIELRIMAALSGDPSMIAAFQENLDVHRATAAKVYGVALDEVTKDMRSHAKMVNFGIIYGISAFGLSQRLGISRSDAAQLIDTYFEEYPGIKQFMDHSIAQARENGFVTTLSGRRRALADIHSANQNIRGNAERAAINTPIQGTAADMIKLAMIQIDSLLRTGSYRSRLLLQVHDELVFDLDREEQQQLIPEILRIMQQALPLPHQVPIVVESGTGENWLIAH
ncbi:MAG: polymerase [Verrucomicrobiota bacterium]